jgi:hypothetical protein
MGQEQFRIHESRQEVWGQAMFGRQMKEGVTHRVCPHVTRDTIASASAEIPSGSVSSPNCKIRAQLLRLHADCEVSCPKRFNKWTGGGLEILHDFGRGWWVYVRKWMNSLEMGERERVASRQRHARVACR